MTLISTHTATSSATVVTDTLWYSQGAERIGYQNKVTVLPHLSTLITSTGSQAFCANWDAYASILASEVRTFDEFMQLAPGGLRTVGEAYAHTMDSIVIHVGYSDLNSRFMAYGHPAWHDFEAVDLGAFFAHPMPLRHAPHRLELERLGRGDDEARRLTREAYPNATAAEVDELMAGRAKNRERMADQSPARSAPKNTRGWVRLAKDARETRAMLKVPTGVKTLIGGQVWQTKLNTPGRVAGADSRVR